MPYVRTIYALFVLLSIGCASESMSQSSLDDALEGSRPFRRNEGSAGPVTLLDGGSGGSVSAPPSDRPDDDGSPSAGTAGSGTAGSGTAGSGTAGSGTAGSAAGSGGATSVDGGTGELRDSGGEHPIVEPDEPDADVVVSVCGLIGGLLCGDGLECIEGACVQTYQCSDDDSCDLRCDAESCAMDCSGANTCKADCGRSASCNVDCSGANNCEPHCRSGACEIDCTGANNCDRVKCDDGATCIMYCSPDTNCKIEGCQEPLRCPGNILVCNRLCPT